LGEALGADRLNKIFQPAGAEIIFRDFGEETVVANLNSGLFYSLWGSAGAIWTGLAAGHTGGQIAAAFRHQDAATVAAEIDAFIGKLLAEQLLLQAPSSAAATVDLPSFDLFSTPALERFDDLQGLLLIDPIHDVSEAGWPLTPGEKSSS
jgi:hypothetical protein